MKIGFHNTDSSNNYSLDYYLSLGVGVAKEECQVALELLPADHFNINNTNDKPKRFILLLA